MIINYQSVVITYIKITKVILANRVKKSYELAKLKNTDFNKNLKEKIV